MKRKQNNDLLIVGAGPVGLCMALAVAKSHFNVTVIDHCDPQAFLNTEYDGRTTAIAYGSLSFFEDIGIWKNLLPQAEPIHDIFVTTDRQSGFIHYQSHEVGDHPFGYIVENHQLRQHLFSALSTYKNVSIFAPTTIKEMTFADYFITANM